MADILKDPVNRLIRLYNDTQADTAIRRIIALAGYPGSGKSTAAKLWVEEVNRKIGKNAIILLGMDGFHLTRARLAAMDDPETAMARRGAPYTFNPLGLIEKLMQLRSSGGIESVGWPGFEHEIGDPVDDEITVPAECSLVLVEGIYTLMRDGLWAGLVDLFDEKWFLDTDIETSMNRLYLRHQAAWGMSPEEAKQRADSNDRLNCEYITPCREAADYLVSG